MEESKAKQEKLTYEQLAQYAGELSQQNQRLVNQIRQMQEALEDRSFNYSSFYLSMLFRVMEHPEMYKDTFVEWVSKEIEDALTSFSEAAKADGSVEEKEKKNEAE